MLVPQRLGGPSSSTAGQIGIVGLDREPRSILDRTLTEIARRLDRPKTTSSRYKGLCLSVLNRHDLKFVSQTISFRLPSSPCGVMNGSCPAKQEAP
jgi:hypothetical protein